MGLYVLFGGVYCLLLIGASLGKSDNRKAEVFLLSLYYHLLLSLFNCCISAY